MLSMKYDKALEYIVECNKLGSRPGLDSIRELCKRLGNPQDDLKFIHVAGTNGKGSILAYISTTLSLAGLKVGRYISPTIVDYRERFQINGKMISKAKCGEYIEVVKEACDEMVKDSLPHPTAFEMETALAFLYFKDNNCDIVLLETGMGGRLDATNIVKTTVMEVFAHIDYDHMQFLGETLKEIATEKAGIIKDNTLVVSGPQSKEALEVLEDSCKKKNSEFIYLDRQEVDSFSYKTSLQGSVQKDNGAVAAKALRTLADMPDIWQGKKPVISEDLIKKGLKETVWPARFQTVRKKPLFIIDGAHNVDAAKRLRETVNELYGPARKIYIVGMFRDKEVDEVIKIMVPDGDMVLTVATPGNPRALESVRLAEIVAKYNPRVTSLDSVEEAVEMSTLLSDKDTVTIAFGSLAYLGRIIDIMDGKGPHGI